MDQKELFEKAKAAASAQDLLTLAKENGVELTEEEAADYFAQMHKSGELSDEELDHVAGGGCHKKDGRLIVTMFYSCSGFTCMYCGKQSMEEHRHAINLPSGQFNRITVTPMCNYCKYFKTERGLRVCNNPINCK